MGELETPIARVWRRLRFQRFLTALTWSWCATLALVAVALAVEKITHRAIPGPAWVPFAVAGGVGLVAAALIALLTGPTRLDAAIAIDHAFHLSERLSTTLTLPEVLRDTPAGRALLADAARRVSGLEVGAEFGPRLPRLAWVPVIPAALAVALVFAPELAQPRAQARTADPKLDRKVVTEQTRALGKKIASQRQELDKTKFPETEKLLAQIEKATDELSKAPPAQKDKALVELNKLTDALKDREKQIGNSEQLTRQLQQLKNASVNGPAEQFAKDLAKGDFQKASNELKNLQEKLKSGKLSDAEKKQLKEQLGDMAKQLQKLANLDERRKQLEEAHKNGGLSKQQFDQEMAKLKQQAQGLQKLQQLAAKLDQAQMQLSQGDVKKAAETLGMSEQQLTEMANNMQELEALDSAMAQLSECKNGMCNGDGLNQFGDEMGGFSDAFSNRRGGQGLGRGRGRGDRPEAPDKTAEYSTQVKQQLGKGKAFAEGTAPSNTPVKGQSFLDVQGEIQAGTSSAADALSNQKVPRNVEKHIRGYFDQINKGK